MTSFRLRDFSDLFATAHRLLEAASTEAASTEAASTEAVSEAHARCDARRRGRRCVRQLRRAVQTSSIRATGLRAATLSHVRAWERVHVAYVDPHVRRAREVFADEADARHGLRLDEPLPSRFSAWLARMRCFYAALDRHPAWKVRLQDAPDALRGAGTSLAAAQAALDDLARLDAQRRQLRRAFQTAVHRRLDAHDALARWCRQRHADV